MFDIFVSGGSHLVFTTFFWLLVCLAARRWELLATIRGEIVTAASLRIAWVASNIMLNLNLIFLLFWIFGITFIP